MAAPALHPVTPTSPLSGARALAAPPARMRAVVHEAYGPPETLVLREIDVPKPGDDDVLVRVHAVGLAIGDSFAARGSPLLMRLYTGILRPRSGIPGFDLAGVVVATGRNVQQFRAGDEVYGSGEGTCAEYACVRADRLAAKPVNVTFEQAAALPTSALAALHGLRDAAMVQAGQKVLINGASGGVGSFAVQIAAWLGAEVTGVCSTGNVEMVRSLGAHHVIDYTREDFTAGGARYDVVLDNIENHSLSEVRRALVPDGTLVLNSGTGASGLAMLVRLLKPLVLSPFVRQRLRRYLSVPNHADLLVLKGLVEAGTLRAVIDSTYPLRETPAALLRIETGHAHGKVVVTV